VASYNRSMRLVYEAGGVKTTIVGRSHATCARLHVHRRRGARSFSGWPHEHFEEIKGVAESATSVGRLQEIEQYLAGRMVLIGFNYTTGDVAGQNLMPLWPPAPRWLCRTPSGEPAPLDGYVLHAMLARRAWHRDPGPRSAAG
jgi:hypothetical protein